MPGFLKNLILIIILIAVVFASFWISFMMGKQILVPVKPLPPAPLISGEATLPPPLTPEKIKIELETHPLPEAKAPVSKPKAKVSVPKKIYTKKITTGRCFVQAGAFTKSANAQSQVSQLKAKGFSAWWYRSGKYYVVTLGTSLSYAEAKALADKAVSKGFEAVVRRK